MTRHSGPQWSRLFARFELTTGRGRQHRSRTYEAYGLAVFAIADLLVPSARPAAAQHPTRHRAPVRLAAGEEVPGLESAGGTKLSRRSTYSWMSGLLPLNVQSDREHIIARGPAGIFRFERGEAMKLQCGIASFAAAAIGFFVLPLRPVVGQSAALHVVVSNGVKTVIDEIRPDWEKAAGHPLTFEFGTTVALKQRIERGEPFDLAVLTSDAISELIKEGNVAAFSRLELARCGIGLGKRANAPKPDIRTVEALKRTLHNATSITFAEAGASRAHLDEMFAQFGMADEMKAKTVLTPSSVESNKLVSEGKAQYILTLVSEILPAPGVDLVGSLPAEVQSYINFAAGASTKPAHAGAEKALLKFLNSAAVAPVFKAKGLETR
jgi:molybdate transport system substrate-binding protein